MNSLPGQPNRDELLDLLGPNGEMPSPEKIDKFIQEREEDERRERYNKQKEAIQYRNHVPKKVWKANKNKKKAARKARKKGR